MKLLFSLWAALIVINTHAQEAPVTDKGDTDAIITNIKMRTESGSKSKYSLAFALGYDLGGLEKPFSEKRGNLSGSAGTTDYTKLSGNVSGKYTVDSQRSVFAGVGVRWITPTRAGNPPGYKGEKIDADNPYARFQYLYRWFGVQASLGFTQTVYTASDLLKKGYVTQSGISQYNAYDFGGSHFSVGFIPYLNIGFFDQDDAASKASQSDYSFGVTPFIEYRVNDWINLRTDSNPAAFEHMRSQSNFSTYNRQDVIQTFNVGFAVTRDIYISPGVLWVVKDPRSDRTTTWISANFNIF